MRAERRRRSAARIVSALAVLILALILFGLGVIVIGAVIGAVTA
jgi:hypothetical protein